jgi:hypothetical protein
MERKTYAKEWIYTAQPRNQYWQQFESTIASHRGQIRALGRADFLLTWLEKHPPSFRAGASSGWNFVYLFDFSLFKTPSDPFQQKETQRGYLKKVMEPTRGTGHKKGATLHCVAPVSQNLI